MASEQRFFTRENPQTKEDFIVCLEERIIRGKLPVGSKLPTERDFETETGIGKSAIHTAMVELEHRGFIDIIPRKGAYVANFAKSGNADTLAAVLRCNGGKMSFKMAVEVVELRNAIEGGALVKLSKCRTEEDLKALNSALDRLRLADVSAMEIPEIAEIEGQFHMLICELSGNDMFSLVMSSFFPISSELWQCCAMFWGVGGFIEHDEHIISLLERGEGAEARSYIESIFAQFLEAYYKNAE